MDAMGAGIDVESLLAQEADERDVTLFGVLYGQAGGWTDGSYYSYASHRSFLDELEAGAAAEQEDGIREWEFLFFEGMADELVKSVVTADVFTEGKEMSPSVE